MTTEEDEGCPQVMACCMTFSPAIWVRVGISVTVRAEVSLGLRLGLGLRSVLGFGLGLVLGLVYLLDGIVRRLVAV